jgi:nascent polypeptide-associated complex subunit alpha
MLPGMNSRQAQQMMRRMGVQQQEMDVVEVIIRTSDKELVFSNPQVSKVNMMGQETYQVVGSPEEISIDSTPEITADDIQTIIDQTGVSKEVAKKSLETSDGDIAKAIIDLQ